MVLGAVAWTPNSEARPTLTFAYSDRVMSELLGVLIAGTIGG